MKRITRRRAAVIAAFALAIMMTGALCSCGGNDQDAATENAEVANPIHEVKSASELSQKTGIEIEAPEGAENVAYSYIDAADGGEIIGQVQFTQDGVEYCYRAMSSGMASINDYIKDGEYSNLAQAMMEGEEIGTDISGMYGPWKAAALVTVQDRDGVCALNEGKEGVILWYDAVPGIMYSLSVNDGANQEAMMAVAEQIFVPVQGDC